jgi:hypothetical protein
MKYLSILLVLALATIPAFAAMDDVTVSGTTITTAGFTNSYTLRGEAEAVVVTVPTAKTATVSIVTASGFTVFSKAQTNGTYFYPVRIPAVDTAGAALSYTVDTSATTNTVYYLTKAPLAELVTFTVNPGTGTTGTNTYSVKLLINK